MSHVRMPDRPHVGTCRISFIGCSRLGRFASACASYLMEVERENPSLAPAQPERGRQRVGRGVGSGE